MPVCKPGKKTHQRKDYAHTVTKHACVVLLNLIETLYATKRKYEPVNVQDLSIGLIISFRMLLCHRKVAGIACDKCLFFSTDEKEKFEPSQFQESIIQGLNQTGTDLEAVAKFLDASGAKLDYRRYAETLFDILVAGGMLGKRHRLSFLLYKNILKSRN